MPASQTDLLRRLATRGELIDKNDIVIGWRDHGSYNRYKVALEVQNAGNLRALAREFVKVVDKAMEETGSTTATWADPAVRLFVNKFESLCRSEATFSEAYAACQEKVNGQVKATHDA